MKHDWTPPQWQAWIVGLKTETEREQALTEVPEAYRKRVENHVRSALWLRDYKERMNDGR